MRGMCFNTVCVLFATSASLCSNSAHAAIGLGDRVVRIEPLAEGLNGVLTGNVENERKQMIPVDMTPLGDGRQLVLTLTGHVRLLQADGTLAAGAYLDTYNSNSPPATGTDFRQIGNTSIAAHPGYLDPSSRGYGKFYVITTELPENLTADFFDGTSSVVDSVITEWTVDPTAIHSATQLIKSGSNANVTHREIMRSQRPGIIHTMVDMAFDPDENLIITSGDGGGNAFPNTEGQAFNQDRFTNGQDPSNVFGSILRIDPLSTGPGDTRPTGGHANQYYIPEDNFGLTDGDPNTPAETFAFGLRSPYRINIDQQTGRIYVGDVGEAAREEISLIENGANYGWGAWEGTRLNRGDLVNFSSVPHTGPVWELFHNIDGGNEANNIIGGFVYRGSLLKGLEGMYIFADTGEDNDGEPNNIVDLYFGDPATTDDSARDDVYRIQIELPDGVLMPDRFWSLAEDENGELYLLVGPDRLDLFNITGIETDGGIWRIVPEPGSLWMVVGLGAVALRRRRY